MGEDSDEERGMIRVLICEDQALIRAGYATIFNSQPDLDVVGEAADGPAGLEAALRLEPDVIVMDIQMPLMDGIEVTTRLAGAGVTNPAKILVVTNFNVDEYVYAALKAGASGFLLKDSPPEELINGVRTIARGESLLAPVVTRTLIGRFAERIRPAEQAPRRQALEALAPRELEVLGLVAQGLSNAEIAAELVIGAETVKTYMSRILTKLNLRDRVQAVVLAYQSGLVAVQD
ncbi:response regulator transcription factor [Amycolatopsis sp. NBC_01480]|uniref:response regulator transcription factor n=1 Tax=Amycolatopsis sp. NBC_01480 TaxID=2903562 RepID=UPI002E2A3B3D|nr:response regulator transcription factor [Amycolatopsis sp. NBC_01480]